VEQAVLNFRVHFSVSKALQPLENLSSSHCIVSLRFMDELYGFCSAVSKVKVKGKVKLSLCLSKHHAMKAYWGSGGIAPLIL
jgi:hypothetical protein